MTSTKLLLNNFIKLKGKHEHSGFILWLDKILTTYNNFLFNHSTLSKLNDSGIVQIHNY